MRESWYLGINQNGVPVIVCDWMWGQFLNVPGGMDTVLQAYVVFVQRISARLRAERGDDYELELVCVNIGGPPPVDFVRELSALRRVDFPERVGSVLIYPMQPSSGRGEIFSDFAKRWSSTKTIYRMIPTAEALVLSTGMEVGSIPVDVLFDAGPTLDQRKIVNDYRRDILMASPPSCAELESDNENAEDILTIKNTFIDLKVRPTKPRRRSFGGVSSVNELLCEGSVSDCSTDCSTDDVGFDATPRSSASNSCCNKSDQDIAEIGFASPFRLQESAPAALPILPPHVGQIVSQILMQASVENFPKQLELKAAELSVAADYLKTMSSQSKMMNEATKAKQLKGQSWAEISDDDTSHISPTDATKPATIAKGEKKPLSGAQRRKLKKYGTLNPVIA